MIIIHAGFLDDQIHLWGERATPKEETSAKRRGRKPKVAVARPFPFDGGVEGLAAVLRDCGAGLKPAKRRFKTAAVWIPAKGAVPIASSPLIAETPRSRARVEILPWSVSLLALSKAECLDLLCECMGKKTLAPGVMAATDLSWWAEALRLAGSLVARQQYLPGLAAVDGSFAAMWEPVVVGDDADYLAALGKRMPSSARALSSADAVSPPDMLPTTALQRFLAQSVDFLVRSTLPAEKQVSRRGRSKKKSAGKSSFSSIHDAWLHALRSPDGTVEWDTGDLEKLAASVLEWRRPIALSASSPFRLCFRLEEPKEAEVTTGRRPKKGANDWYVRYLLQPREDRSLLVPVADAWKGKGRKALVLKRYGPEVREYMLSALGQAAGICAHVSESLKTAEPAGCKLGVADAHNFLTEKAATLEQAGFGVMLPAWWTRKGTKMRLTARANVKSPKMQGGGKLSLQSIAQFDWEIALGDKKLSFSELQALAKLKAPLVQIRGEWVELNALEIQEALDFWKKKGAGQATVQDVMKMALGAREGDGGFILDGVEADGWIGEFLERLDSRAEFEELSPPRGFSGTLRPYQVRGYSWLGFLRQWGLGACLADDMGLGKTIQTLALVQRDWKANRKNRRPVLLICPTSVVNNWQKEAARFTPELPVLVHHGIERRKGQAFAKAAKKQAMVISSYGLLLRDVEFMKNVEWGGLVLDEAQNIKNPETRQARAARSVEADYRITLTGTPVENNVGDLWSIMEFLNPGFLGTRSEFKRNFFIPIQAQRDPAATERLKRIIGPFILRRLKTDKSIISDLPEKMEMKVFCSLTKEQASLYAAVLKDIEGGLEVFQDRRKNKHLSTPQS